MELSMQIFKFLASWLLFSFPLYQGCLELTEQNILLEKYKSKDKPKSISPWYWIVPPLKIYKEKERAVRILRSMGLTPSDQDHLLLFFDKATAWFYVSIASMLIGISATYDLFVQLGIGHNLALFYPLVAALVLLGVLNVVYRLSRRRRTKVIAKILGQGKNKDRRN